jgi:hypothetical protein
MATIPHASPEALRSPFPLSAGFLIATVVVVAGFRWTEVFEVVSFFILGAIAVVAMRIYAVRRAPDASWLAGTGRIWLLIALGFAFLALDEALSVHERMDLLVHRVFSLPETRITDRIDDLIILVYAIVGILLLYVHRAEFRNLTGHRRFFVAGFLLLSVMVVIDLLSNRRDFLHWIGVSGPMLGPVHHVMEVSEEVVKLLAEVAFLLGFVHIHRQVVTSRKATSFLQAPLPLA